MRKKKMCKGKYQEFVSCPLNKSLVVHWNKYNVFSYTFHMPLGLHPFVFGTCCLRAPYTLSWTVQFNCIKKLHGKRNWMFSGTAQVFHQVCQFLQFCVYSCACDHAGWNKAVICCLLATSAIMLTEKKERKRKIWNKKWYLKRNVSCDAQLSLVWVPWSDAIVVSAGKLRKLWDSLSELRSSLCERRLERTVLRPALLPVKIAEFTQFFRQVWRHTVKSLDCEFTCIVVQWALHRAASNRAEMNKL
jgi:hypothetical protein